MKPEVDDENYSEVVSLEAYRRCTVLEGRRDLLWLRIG